MYFLSWYCFMSAMYGEQGWCFWVFFHYHLMDKRCLLKKTMLSLNKIVRHAHRTLVALLSFNKFIYSYNVTKILLLLWPLMCWRDHMIYACYYRSRWSMNFLPNGKLPIKQVLTFSSLFSPFYYYIGITLQMDTIK